MYINCESVYSSSLAVTQTSETLRKKKLIRYLCFIPLFTSFIVVINVSKRVTLCWRKTDFGQSIWPTCDPLTTAFTILNCLEHDFLEGFWSKGDNSHFENLSSFQISWICSDVFQINEKFIHNCPPCLLAEMAKVASSVARPRKCNI